MERLRGAEGAFPQACFMCPAREFINGEYVCNPNLLDSRTQTLTVARYRPDKCPQSGGRQEPRDISPEILLRKMLHK